MEQEQVKNTLWDGEVCELTVKFVFCASDVRSPGWEKEKTKLLSETQRILEGGIKRAVAELPPLPEVVAPAAKAPKKQKQARKRR